MIRTFHHIVSLVEYGVVMEYPESHIDPQSKNLSKDKDLTTLIYALQAIGYFIGITAVVAVIMNYVKKSDVEGTWLESHFNWQIKTFWFSILWFVVGLLTAIFIVGYFILLANWVWGIYRIVKGWLALNDNKPMYS